MIFVFNFDLELFLSITILFVGKMITSVHIVFSIMLVSMLNYIYKSINLNIKAIMHNFDEESTDQQVLSLKRLFELQNQSQKLIKSFNGAFGVMFVAILFNSIGAITSTLYLSLNNYENKDLSLLYSLLNVGLIAPIFYFQSIFGSICTKTMNEANSIYFLIDVRDGVSKELKQMVKMTHFQK